MRSDFVGAYNENSMTRTPNINAMVRRGSSFKYAVTNQPLCSPSRACMITGRYATETGEGLLSPTTKVILQREDMGQMRWD